MMRVVFTPRAERQSDALFGYIASKASERVADGYVGRLVAFCQKLSAFPLRGTARDDLLPGLRTVGFEHRATVAIVIGEDAVVIEGVFYGGQDFEASFRSKGATQSD